LTWLAAMRRKANLPVPEPGLVTCICKSDKKLHQKAQSGWPHRKTRKDKNIMEITEFANSLDGTQIAYDCSGAGPVVILLHGGTANPSAGMTAAGQACSKSAPANGSSCRCISRSQRIDQQD